MEQQRPGAARRPHQLILQERHILELTGVTDVEGFDDTVVTAYTDLGQISVHGKELHIQNLDVSGGSLSVVGTVDSVSYADAPQKGGFLSRLFR